MAVRSDKNVFMGSHPYNDMRWEIPEAENSKVKNLDKLQDEYDNSKLKSKFRPSFLRTHYFSGSNDQGQTGL